MATEQQKLYRRKYWQEHPAEKKVILARYRMTHSTEYKNRIYFKHSLKKKYGMTEADWANMFLHQGGKCAICGDWLDLAFHGHDSKIHIDHNHTTGKVRGMLCSACNHAVGFLRDNPKLALKVANYLWTR